MPDYTSIHKRVCGMIAELGSGPDMGRSDGIVVAIDSTGIKVTNGGDWICTEWIRGRSVTYRSSSRSMSQSTQKRATCWQPR